MAGSTLCTLSFHEIFSHIFSGWGKCSAIVKFRQRSNSRQILVKNANYSQSVNFVSFDCTIFFKLKIAKMQDQSYALWVFTRYFSIFFQAGESVQQLLNSAKERIPAKYWSKTPITLKATAGLRLLPQEQSEAIIIEVKKVLENSGFQTITGYF